MGLCWETSMTARLPKKGMTFPSKTLAYPRVFLCQLREPNQATRANPVKTGDAKLRVFLHQAVEMIAEPPKWDKPPEVKYYLYVYLYV